MEKMQVKTAEKATLRILIIEDSDTDAFVLQKMLKGGMRSIHCTRASTLKAGEDILEKNGIDLLFLDLSLPDTATPADTYARIKKWAEKLPIIVMTSLKDHELAKNMVQEGAADFINKDSIAENPRHVQDAIDFSIARHALSRKMLAEKQTAVQESKDKDSILKCFMGGYSVDDK